ncbi:MAG: endolytic transglycosylase MltG, partial [Selenomonadaceae bacterium]|nr:endolytic transglycosylase MltG [Selenomonadaceae bacterium]
TIPEGFGVKEIAERLQNLDLAEKDEFLKAAADFAPYDYMKKRENVFYAAEGFLFPDTYAVESDMEVNEILDLMAKTFDDKLKPYMRKQAAEMGLSIYDLIILASLVEREVRFPEDRPIVAQVLLKRLKLNMPLQTDATLQYLMDTPKEDVSIADTQIDSPYNTYQHMGLPPGPIANPGMASIEAVLHPADTEYLYFVADRRGHNHYATTYEEHLNLVNQYR